MANTAQKKKQTSWGVIILFLVIFFPVGIFLIYTKITGDKEGELKNSKVLKNLGWVCVTFAVIYLIMIITGDVKTEDGTSAIGPLIVAFLFFGGGGVFMLHTSKKIRSKAEKVRKYIAIIMNNNQTSIDNIAAAVPICYEKAMIDLQKMIDDGYFENAYIDVSKREIVLPKKKNAQNCESPNVKNDCNVNESKIKIVVCKNCSANNKVVEGQICECEYCGSLIK